jgi:hypothetical protein
MLLTWPTRRTKHERSSDGGYMKPSQDDQQWEHTLRSTDCPIIPRYLSGTCMEKRTLQRGSWHDKINLVRRDRRYYTSTYPRSGRYIPLSFTGHRKGMLKSYGSWPTSSITAYRPTGTSPSLITWIFWSGLDGKRTSKPASAPKQAGTCTCLIRSIPEVTPWNWAHPHLTKRADAVTTSSSERLTRSKELGFLTSFYDLLPSVDNLHPLYKTDV